MRLLDLIESLQGYTNDAELVFSAQGNEIRAGYHLTEFKLARISSIDSGARTSSWTEASMQLLDGEGGDVMPIGKFLGIARKSVEVIENLGDVELSVEFAPGNEGMRIYDLSLPQMIDGRVHIALKPKTAACKPKLDFLQAKQTNPTTQTSCCGPARTSCC